ncbi:MAG: HEPN domain-containing protein [Ardenticatenaceae bacterium]
MKNAIDQFQQNLTRVRHLSEIVSAVDNLTTSAIDMTDILRAEIVLAVSALDFLVHELVRLGMLEVYRGSRTPTKAYLRFQAPMRLLQNGISNPTDKRWLDEAIQERHGWLSFQEPDKIADAIRHISDVKLWRKVGGELGMEAAEVKRQLKEIVERRNKIAHEADMNPDLPGHRLPISEPLVHDSVDFIEAVGEAIYKVI